MRRGRHAVPNMTLRPSGSTSVTTTSSTLNGETPRLSKWIETPRGSRS